MRLVRRLNVVLLKLHLNLLLHLLLDDAVHLLLYLVLDHFLHLHLKGTFHQLHAQFLLGLGLMGHLHLQLLLAKHAYSLMDKEKAFQAVLIVVHHVFLPIFLFCQLLTQCKVDVIYRLFNVIQHLFESGLNSRHNCGSHGLSKLLDNQLFNSLLTELLLLALFLLQLVVGYQGLKEISYHRLELRYDLFFDLGIETSHFLSENRNNYLFDRLGQ